MGLISDLTLLPELWLIISYLERKIHGFLPLNISFEENPFCSEHWFMREMTTVAWTSVDCVHFSVQTILLFSGLTKSDTDGDKDLF